MPSICLPGRYFRMYPANKPLGHAEKQLQLDTSQTVFLLVDVYDPALEPGGARSPWELAGSFIEQSKQVMPAMAAARQAARKINLPIVYLANSAPRIALADSTYQEMKTNTVNANKDELFAEDNIDPLEYHHGKSQVLKYASIIKPQDGDYYIRKHAHSGFFDTRLDTLLRNLGCKTLVCVGFTLDMCLGATMIDALWRNYRVVLLRDCTRAFEITGVDQPNSWTNRWVLYTESAIGYSATSNQWIAACNTLQSCD